MAAPVVSAFSATDPETSEPTASPAAAPSPGGDGAPPQAPSLLYDGILWLFRRVIGVYFRAIEVTGNLPAADTGGRIFVSNHTNGLVDAILVLTTAPCHIAPV